MPSPPVSSMGYSYMVLGSRLSEGDVVEVTSSTSLSSPVSGTVTEVGTNVFFSAAGIPLDVLSLVSTVEVGMSASPMPLKKPVLSFSCSANRARLAAISEGVRLFSAARSAVVFLLRGKLDKTVRSGLSVASCKSGRLSFLAASIPSGVRANAA